MGIQGTEVAKESSDIIILDDNFSSVVKVSLQCHKYVDETDFMGVLHAIPSFLLHLGLTFLYIVYNQFPMC